MTILLFWIACALVQESACLHSDAHEITTVIPQNAEHSETKPSPTHLSFNEAFLLTTGVNDIECSNTEGCFSPINLLTTPTVLPAVFTKVTWHPVTNRRIPTEASVTSTGTTSISYPQQYNPTTGKLQDSTISTTDDDGGNELDSEVKDMKDFTKTTNIVTPTENLVDSTNTPLSEMINITSFAKNTDSLTILKNSTEEPTIALMQKYTSQTISSELHSISQGAIPVSKIPTFSDSRDQTTVIPTRQSNAVDTVYNLHITTKMPNVPTVEAQKVEDPTDFAEDIKNMSMDLRVSTVRTHLELHAHSLPHNSESTSNVTVNSELHSETKFKITTIPYSDTEEVELNTTHSYVNLEPLMQSESYLQMYTVNASEKEISEGHGLKRNLSYFIKSTEHPNTNTEVQDYKSTELYPEKDIFTTMPLEIMPSSFLPNINGTVSSTPASQNATLINLLVKEKTLEESNWNTTSESATNIPYFSELIKLSTALTNTEDLTLVGDRSITLPTSYATDENGINDKELGVTNLTESSLVTEAILSEQSTLKKFNSTSKVSYTEKSPLTLLTTTMQFQEPNIVRDTTLPSIENATEVNDSSTDSVSTIINIQNIKYNSRQSTETSFSSNEYHTTPTFTHSFTTYKEAETTTINPLHKSISSPSVTYLPSSISTSSSSDMMSEESILPHSFTDQKPTSLQITHLPTISTNSETTQWHMSRKESEISTHSLPEQTSPSVLATQPPSATSNFISVLQTITSTYKSYLPTPTISSVILNHSVDFSASSTIVPVSTIIEEPVGTQSSPIDATNLLTTMLENLSHSSFSTTLSPVTFTQTETRRGGKHIPFSTAATTRETVASSENGIIHVISTDLHVKNDTEIIYKQIQFEELKLTDKANVITATIQFPSKQLNGEINVKMMKVHYWLLHVLMKEFQNWTRDPFEETEDQLNATPFGNISIFYVSPTPEMNLSSITLTFIVYNIWKNETLQVDFVLGILNYYSRELKESINASAIYFSHGYVVQNHYLVSAILERYGIIIATICVAVILILLLVCVVIFYRKKTRRSVHCLSNSKFKQNMQEAVGIDLTPAIIILQEEKGQKVGNGNKICDDEGWLAPINDVPQAEETNVPFIQDTKL